MGSASTSSVWKHQGSTREAPFQAVRKLFEIDSLEGHPIMELGGEGNLFSSPPPICSGREGGTIGKQYHGTARALLTYHQWGAIIGASPQMTGKDGGYNERGF